MQGPREYHIPELQSIRGIAAIVVLIHHASICFSTSAGFHYWSEFFLNAHAAVVLFFVLSGFVLARSLNSRPLSFSEIFYFYMGRCFRIYPALWLACVLFLVYFSVFHSSLSYPDLSTWFETYDRPVPGRLDIALQFAGLRSVLIPPSWSITVEIYGSFLLPLFVLAARARLSLWLLLVSLGLALLPSAHGHALIYVPSFVAGVVAFWYRQSLERTLARPVISVICLLVLLFFRRLSPDWYFDVDPGAAVPSVVESLAAVGVVLGAASHRPRALSGKAVVWIGDISYSVYILHYIVLAALAHLLLGAIAGDLAALWLMAATLCVTLAISTASFAWVEKPGIQAGKFVIGKLKLAGVPRKRESH